MKRRYKAGDVVRGKVTGIQPYGAFVALDDQTQGLVHISEITYGYVKDVADFLAIGEKVKVKVLDVDPSSGKTSLSIRELQEKPVIPRSDGHDKLSLQGRVEGEDAEGFHMLRQKLDEWIEEFQSRRPGD